MEYNTFFLLCNNNVEEITDIKETIEINIISVNNISDDNSETIYMDGSTDISEKLFCRNDKLIAIKYPKIKDINNIVVAMYIFMIFILLLEIPIILSLYRELDLSYIKSQFANN